MDRMVLGEASLDEATLSSRNGDVWDDAEQRGRSCSNDMRHIRCFSVKHGLLYVVVWQRVPWQLVTEGKLNPKRVVAFLLGAGHHVHAVAFKF